MNCPAGTSTNFMPTELVVSRGSEPCGRTSHNVVRPATQGQAGKVEPRGAEDSTAHTIHPALNLLSQGMGSNRPPASGGTGFASALGRVDPLVPRMKARQRWQSQWHAFTPAAVQ